MSLEEYNYEYTDKDVNEVWNVDEYKILNAGSGNGTFSKDASQAPITYICEYDYVDRFLDVVLGKTVKVGDELIRSADFGPNFDPDNGSTPQEHDFFWNFFAFSAEVNPLGKPTQTDFGASWKKAAITVVFRPPTYNIIPDFGEWDDEFERYTTKVPEGTAEFQTTLGFFSFVDDANPLNRRVLDINPAQTVAAQRLSYTWHQIPVKMTANGNPDLGVVPNIATILPLLGSTNDVAFDTYEPGTVMFTTWSAKLVLPQCATNNGYYWDITYVFGVRDYGESLTPMVADEHIGWNYAFDPLSNLWRLYTTDGTTSGRPQYPYADLNDLFAVGW